MHGWNSTNAFFVYAIAQLNLACNGDDAEQQFEYFQEIHKSVTDGNADNCIDVIFKNDFLSVLIRFMENDDKQKLQFEAIRIVNAISTLSSSQQQVLWREKVENSNS